MKRPVIDFLVQYDDESILAELRRIAKVTGLEIISKKDIQEFGRVSPSAVIKRFGSLRHALGLAGLRSTRFMKATDDELLGILIDLWQQVLEKEGRTPQRDDLKKYGFQVSDDVFARRFGGWRRALMRAHESITEETIEESPAVNAEPMQAKRQALSIRKRFFVMKRDHFACVRCGASGNGVKLEVHHRFPFAKGGSDHLTNLETLCFACNRGQRDTVV